MKANSGKENSTARALSTTLMEAGTLGSPSTAKGVARALTTGLMEIGMRANSGKENATARALTTGLMALSAMGNGRMINTWDLWE